MMFVCRCMSCCFRFMQGVHFVRPFANSKTLSSLSFRCAILDRESIELLDFWNHDLGTWKSIGELENPLEKFENFENLQHV